MGHDRAETVSDFKEFTASWARQSSGQYCGVRRAKTGAGGIWERHLTGTRSLLQQ